MIRTTMSAEDMKPKPSEAEIEGFETVYDYDFKDLVPTLKKYREDGTLSSECKFYAWTDHKFTVSSFDNFVGMPIDDHVLLNKAGERFDALYKPGDPESLSKIKDIVRSELEKGLLSTNATAK